MSASRADSIVYSDKTSAKADSKSVKNNDIELSRRSIVVSESLVDHYVSCDPSGADVPPFLGVACHGCDAVSVRRDYNVDEKAVCAGWEMNPRRFDGRLIETTVFTDPYVKEGYVFATPHSVMLPQATCPTCAKMLRPFRQGQAFTSPLWQT